MSEHLLAAFPGLRSSPFHITSPADEKYNCIAWAVNDTSNWWWPLGDAPTIVWPPNSSRAVTLDAFAAALLTLGYIPAANESLEAGFEKIALFADDAGIPKHAARQLTSGRWTSKLGNAEDIEHELRAIEGDIYGRVTLLLKRPVINE